MTDTTSADAVDSGRVTALLRAFADGDRASFDELVPLLYGDLVKVAHARLRAESSGHTLDTRALVHEAWLRLVDQTRTTWRSREHFLAVASEVMRRILVDHAKARAAAKRGQGVAAVSLDAVKDAQLGGREQDMRDEAVVALDGALHQLAMFNPEGARVVQYRAFAGLTNAEIALVMNSSERTVRRMWTVAKAWLHRELGDAWSPAR